MITINLTSRDGSVRELSVQPGTTLMQAIRDAGSDDIEAVCGGCASCATCHVYIELPPGGEPLPKMEEIEDELLESSFVRQSSSRLSCQLPLTGAQTFLSVTIPQE